MSLRLRRGNKAKSLLSHSCLLLLAIIPLDPSQTPLESVATQLPLNKECPEAHTIQLFDDGPLQVLHDAEQGEHSWPALKDPAGHVVPPDVTDGSGSHFVLSDSSWVKPCLQEMQVAVPSEH